MFYMLHKKIKSEVTLKTKLELNKLKFPLFQRQTKLSIFPSFLIVYSCTITFAEEINDT